MQMIEGLTGGGRGASELLNLPRGESMSTDKNVDEGKGRLKEAAGSLTDNDDLKNEGKVDRAKASVKEKVDKVAEKAKDALDRDGK
jgi:uncharacterized protein YjbJ (UPF0337 family)